MKKNSLWLLPFSLAVATYFYYEKMRRTMRTTIVSYFFKSTFANLAAIFQKRGLDRTSTLRGGLLELRGVTFFKGGGGGGWCEGGCNFCKKTKLKCEICNGKKNV